MYTFRFADYSTPLRAIPGQRQGRFNRVGDPTLQYLADHPLTPWAELLRWSPENPPDNFTARLWVILVDESALPEVTFANALKRFAIMPNRLVADDDYSDCQDLAMSLRGSGEPGMIVPNAALPGTRSVILFGAYVMTGLFTSRPAWDQLPCSMTADRARPPEETSALVRRRGETHRGLQRFLEDGGTYQLDEPVLFAYHP